MTLDGVRKCPRGHRAGQHTTALVAMFMSLRSDRLLTRHSSVFVLFAGPVKRKRIPGLSKLRPRPTARLRPRARSGCTRLETAGARLSPRRSPSVRLRSVAVFPAPIGENPSVVLPLASSSSDDFGEKRTRLVVPTRDTPITQNVCHDRTFECRVDGITGQRRIRTMVGQRLLPRPGDRFYFFVLGRTLRGMVANTSAPSLTMLVWELLWDNVIAHIMRSLSRA